MKVPQNTEELRKRIHSIEHELFELRCQLDSHAMEIPAGMIEALEILVADTWYAVNLAPVREVIPILRCDPLQESPEWILGTFQYEDDIVPVVDTNFRLNGELTVLRPALKIVLVDALRLTGFVVSDIGDIITFRREQIVPVSSGIPHADHLIGALRKADGTSVHLLSVESLSRAVGEESHQDG